MCEELCVLLVREYVMCRERQTKLGHFELSPDLTSFKEQGSLPSSDSNRDTSKKSIKKLRHERLLERCPRGQG